MSVINSSTFTEIKIPNEYGYIAAKQWGKPQGKPVLALHGWQDNACTFDPLIQWLDGNLRIVAIDFPGHGFSSHLPVGCYYQYMDMLCDIKRVAQHFKWKKFTLLGHSMGGGASLMYASLFPDEIESVISLDIYKPLSIPQDLLPARTSSGIKERLLLSEKLRRPEPVYTEEVALNRLVKGQGGSTTVSSAKTLLKRGVKPSPDGKGVIYTRDIRLQSASLQYIDDRMLKDYLKNLKCRLLVVTANNGIKYEKPETWLNYKEMYLANSKEFRAVEVEGTHHVHMNSPELVAPLINSFLDSSRL